MIKVIRLLLTNALIYMLAIGISLIISFKDSVSYMTIYGIVLILISIFGYIRIIRKVDNIGNINRVKTIPSTVMKVLSLFILFMPQCFFIILYIFRKLLAIKESVVFMETFICLLAIASIIALIINIIFILSRSINEN